MTFADMSTFILEMALSDNRAYAARVQAEIPDRTTLECRYYRSVFETVKRGRGQIVVRGKSLNAIWRYGDESR